MKASMEEAWQDGALLDVRDMATRFTTRRGVVNAVNTVSFSIGKGELVGLVGESGSGKSVTIRSILGLVRPPGRVIAGTALFEGRDLLGMSRRQLRRVRGSEIGFVGQNPFGALNPVLKIERQFYNLVTAHRPAKHAEVRATALSTLKAVGIPGPERVLDGYAHELSGGMAQRVVIAMALVLDPKLVIADEPTTALDVTVQRQILDLIHNQMVEGDRSMLLVSHDLGVVAHYCQKVIVMYAGKVVEAGPVAEVFKRPAHPYTLALLQAIPTPGRRLVSLVGRVPDLIHYPSGCPFKSRCRFVQGQCDHDVPELRQVGEGRTASCHFDLDLDVNETAKDIGVAGRS